MREYIAETASGSMFTFMLADHPDDGWDCVKTWHSANAYWHRCGSWNPSDPFFAGHIIATWIEWADDKDIIGTKQPQRGWMVCTDAGTILRDLAHLKDFHKTTVRDPIVKFMNQSLIEVNI